jgi:hypothetical protein
MFYSVFLWTQSLKITLIIAAMPSNYHFINAIIIYENIMEIIFSYKFYRNK